MRETVLFIPLRAAFFEAFESGLKKIEYRPHGKRWNSATCRVGRRVLLSRGYGRSARLCGEVVGFETSKLPCQTSAWVQCYGPKVVDVACIKIKVKGRVCDWCFGTGKRTHVSDLGDATGQLCSLCEGSGEAGD